MARKGLVPQSSLSRDKRRVGETFHICCCPITLPAALVNVYIGAQLITMTNTFDKPNISSRDPSALISIKYRYKQLTISSLALLSSN